MKLQVTLIIFALFIADCWAQEDITSLPEYQKEQLLKNQRPDDPQLVEEERQEQEEAPRKKTFKNEFDMNPAYDQGNGTTTNRGIKWPEP